NDKENSDRSLVPFMEVIDQGLISHHAYRKLAAIQHELSRAYEISDTEKDINQEMSTQIPIFTLNIKNMSLETSDVDLEVLKYIGKACYRRITDILIFIIPSLVDRNILNTNDLVINIRISGDGHNVES
ncbi:11408_t:CDS:2, partial [Racocetra fulgida]